ncbi:MAG: DUF4861 family protein [Bacteroidota bacterium]
MKYFAIILIVTSNAFAQKNDVPFSVTNPIASARHSETVSIDLRGFFQHHPALKGKTLSILEKKKVLVSQVIDNDQDGVDDELIFQSSFAANETKRFAVHSAAKEQQFTSVTDCRYVLPRADLAWENDRIAFRIYGSVLAGNVDNGTDVWTKRVRYPIVKKWYDGEEQTPKMVYHEDHGEGADFFSVGRSLGAGSAGLVWNGKLVQPGLFNNFRIICTGPIRTSFEVYYTKMMLDSFPALIVKRVTLDAGEQLNSVTERYITAVKSDSLILQTGLVKRKSVLLNRSADGRILSLWGPVNADAVNGNLGTAVILARDNVSASADTLHFYLSSSFAAQQQISYYSGAAWSRMGDITGEQQWNGYLEDFLRRIQKPLIITFH